MSKPVRFRYLDRAIDESKDSPCRTKVGAVLHRGKSTYATHNTNKTHPMLRQFGYPDHSGMHAELRAVLDAPFDPMGGTLYVGRLGRDGRLRNARPCSCCRQVLQTFGIKQVVYTVTDGARVAQVPRLEVV